MLFKVSEGMFKKMLFGLSWMLNGFGECLVWLRWWWLDWWRGLIMTCRCKGMVIDLMGDEGVQGVLKGVENSV